MSGEVFHAPYIESNPHFCLKYILERTKERSAERYPNATIVRSYEEILADKEVELVVVNTPHALHHPMAKMALLAGKHVIIEKPFAVNVEQCLELQELAQTEGLMIAVYHNKRLEGDYTYFKSLLERKDWGALQQVDIRYDRWKPKPGHKLWKEQDLPGAGILYDLGSHLIDFSLSLFGKPNNITAKEKIERMGSPISDAFDIQLAYEGFNVNLGASMMTKEPGPKVVARWEHAEVSILGNDPQEGLLINGISPTNSIFDQESVPQKSKITSSGNELEETVPMGDYNLFYQNVYEHLHLGNSLYVSPVEATDVLRVIQVVRS
jgi:predicted dehydrogenase